MRPSFSMIAAVTGINSVSLHGLGLRRHSGQFKIFGSLDQRNGRDAVCFVGKVSGFIDAVCATGRVVIAAVAVALATNRAVVDRLFLRDLTRHGIHFERLAVLIADVD